MAKVMKEIIFISYLSLGLAGCANFSPPISQRSIVQNGSQWLTYDASRRGTLVVSENGKIIRSCAEPAPDTANSFVNSLKGTFKTAGGTSAEGVDASLNATALALAGRDNLVLLARESLFRLCEARANGDISEKRYADIFQDVLQQIKEISEAEKAKSAAIQSVAKAVTK